MNTTIKLCRVLRIITVTLNLKRKFNFDLKHIVFKKIYDNIVFTLRKNKTVEHTQVETLYLLIALCELGNKYWLTEEILASYLRIGYKDQMFYSETELNYFSIVVSLFYMKDKSRFRNLRNFILEKVVEKFENIDSVNLTKKTELILLLFDIIAYPFIDIDCIKRKLLSLYDIKDHDLQTNIIKARDNWFTTWSNFNFGKALDAKQSQEVY